VNYGVFSACITTYVVLLLSALGLPEPQVAWHRIAATLLGAAVALSVHLPSLRHLARVVEEEEDDEDAEPAVTPVTRSA
jgi:uncharacterized membrane protein YccC